MEEEIMKCHQNVLRDSKVASERSSIKINWKVQSINQDNLATWLDAMILIHSAIRTLVTGTMPIVTAPSSANDNPIEKYELR